MKLTSTYFVASWEAGWEDKDGGMTFDFQQLGYYGFINMRPKEINNPRSRLRRDLFGIHLKVEGSARSWEVTDFFDAGRESVFPELKRRILELQEKLNKFHPLLDSWVLNWPVEFWKRRTSAHFTANPGAGWRVGDWGMTFF